MSKVIIDSSAVTLVLNVLRRDCERGMQVRGEIAELVRQSIESNSHLVDRLSLDAVGCSNVNQLRNGVSDTNSIS